MEARLEAQDRLHRRNEMEKQVDNLKERYGDFDESELYQHALSNRIGNLEAAFTHMRYGDVADRAEKLEKEQERTEAKRDAGVVEPTGSKQTGSSTNTSPKNVGSLREAYAEAKRELAG